MTEPQVVPLSVALVAGGLATLNPCGVPVLAAFLAYVLGGGEVRPRPRQVARGLVTGLQVTAGFLGVFTVLGLPLSYGVAAISEAVPWLGLGFGAALFVAGVATLVGRRIGLPAALRVKVGARRWVRTPVLFGVGYGVASLGCTLPVFLVLVGAAASGGGSAATPAVFAAYGAGMASVVVALAVGATLVSGGLIRWARRVLPYLQPVTGVLLVVAGGYLGYYWVRVGFGSPAQVASDPLVAVVTDFAASVEARARGGGVALVVAAAAFIAAAAWLSRWRWSRRENSVSATDRPGSELPQDQHRDRPPTQTPRLLVAGGVVIAVLSGLAGYTLGAGGSKSADSSSQARSGELSTREATQQERESLRGDGHAAGLSDFTGMDHLQAWFDAHAGATRIIALLSPTCVACLRGANWLNEELAKYPDANVAVYAVWLPMLPTDERGQWDDRILSDPRAIQVWDEDRVTGRWFAQHGYGDLPIQWDAVFVYGPDARWGGNDQPLQLAIWRRPVIAYSDELSEAMRPLLERS